MCSCQIVAQKSSNSKKQWFSTMMTKLQKLRVEWSFFFSNICSAIVLAAVRCRKINGLVYEAACICNAYRDRNTLCKFEITLILFCTILCQSKYYTILVLNFIYFGHMTCTSYRQVHEFVIDNATKSNLVQLQWIGYQAMVSSRCAQNMASPVELIELRIYLHSY